MAEKKQTLFAPAERDGQPEVQKQSKGLLAVSMLRQLLDAVPDIMVILNDKRQVVFANQRLLDFLGCEDPKQVYGARTGEILRCAHADETAGGCGTSESCRHCGAVLAILSGLKGEKNTRECRIMRKENGEALNLRVTTTPFALEGRQYTIFCVDDVSHEKRRQVLERVLFKGILEDARQVRQEAANLREADPAQLELFRGTAYRFSDELIEEVNEHRIVTAAESGELNIQSRGVSTLEALKQVVQIYEKRPEAEGRSLRIQRQARDTVILTDPLVLKQVLGYMIQNALEGCERGDAVTLNADNAGKTAEFVVHNPGYMPREVQLQVFQRGFSTKAEDRGMGTYAMRLLTEKYLKGKVSFTSTERVGTVFRLALPEMS